MASISRASKNTHQAISSTMPLPPLQNPLSSFPGKNDNISKAFFGVELPKQKKKLVISKSQRSSANHQGTLRSEDDFISRPYRRIGSSVLFTTPAQDSTSLGELMNPIQSQHKNYVVVEESRFAEIAKFENALKEEKEKIGEQGAWVLSDIQMTARIPVPAMRMAIHNLCESEMKKYAHEIMELSRQWNIYCKQNHLNKPHLFNKNSYIECAPLEQRRMKLILVKEASRNWHLKINRDSMTYEDDVSYLTGKYLDAKERKKDYDRYYVLATRYGYYTELEYKNCQEPGKTYWTRALNGALKFQRAWDRYWSMRKLLRHKSSIMIQTNYRAHSAYLKFHLIIVFRVKVGKRSYYRFCMQLWREYLHLVKVTRDTINYMRGRFQRECFYNWAKWARASRARKDLVMTRFVMRIKMAPVVLTFDAWKRWTKNNIWIKLRTRRLMQNPHFAMWVDFTRRSKHYKYIFKKSSKCQSIVRMWYASRKWKKQHAAITMLHVFGKIMRSVYRSKHVRHAIVEREFVEWYPGHLEDRIAEADDNERRRTQKCNLQSSNREKAELIELRKHLRSGHGRIQLKEHAALLSRVNKETGVKVKGSMKAYAEKDLLERCSQAIKSVERHDFNAKTAPFIRCADFGCRAICTLEEQYHTHCLNSPHHTGENSIQFSHIHLMLRNPSGQTQVRNYLTRTQGIGEVLNCLDCWSTIQEWRKISTKGSSGAYGIKVLNIYDLFIRADSSRPLGFTRDTFPNFETLVEKFEVYKNREFNGYYFTCRAEISFIREQIGFPGKEYTKWGTENVFTPDTLDELEWNCFLTVFNAVKDRSIQHHSTSPIVVNDSNSLFQFQDSIEGLAYQEVLTVENAYKREQHVDDYLRFRMNNMLEWAHSYKQRDLEFLEKAVEVTDQVIEREIDHLVDLMLRPAVADTVFEKMLKEQSYYESVSGLTEEAVSWSEIDLLEEVYEFYTKSLLETMWEISECKKGMMEYAGLLKGKAKKKLVIHQKKDERWFEEFFSDLVRKERDSMPIDSVGAAIRIQTRCRGVLGRNIVRKLFVKVFVKRWDKESDAAYYVNINTNETAWERPKMMSKLFPKSTW